MSEDVKLSSRQQNMLRYIYESMALESRPPTIREIGGALGISSTSVVNYNLNRLTEKGLLERDRTVSRGLRLTDMAYGLLGTVASSAVNQISNLVRIPILGNIMAGEPIDVTSDNFDVYDDEDYVELSASMLTGNRNDMYALRVDGYSMIDDMISDGDIVILQAQETANDGDVVAVWVETEGTTLKRFYREPERGMVRLQPRNPSMEPILVNPDNVTVQGKLILTLSQAA